MMTAAYIAHALMARTLYEAHSSVECLSIEDLRDLQLPNSNSQADTQNSWLPALPDRVVVTNEAEEEEAIILMDHLFQAHMDRWSLADRDRVFTRGTRFEDENPAPQYPLITRSSRRTSDPSFMVLADGRRVLQLDAQRLLTLCGIQEVLLVQDVRRHFFKRSGRGRCASCQGNHLAASHVTDHAEPLNRSTGEAFSCPRCHVPIQGNYIQEDADTFKCLCCSHRVYREHAIGMAGLDAEDIAHNEEQIARACYVEDTHSVESSEEDAFDLDSAHGGEDFGDDTVQFSPSDYLEYESSHEIDQDDLPTDDTEVDIPDLQDRLHAPAYALFCQGRHPLRQALLNQAILELDSQENRMPVWVAAGRILTSTPHHLSPSDAQAITTWLNSLPHEDLAILAGDPNTNNERLAHPELGLFFPTDQLLLPLIRFFGHSLKRFRNKAAGCRILAEDYGLTESAIKQIAMACGQLPAISASAPTPGA
ncbi:MAG: hypothetical protein H8K06_11950 [Nitrospira sp.]|nr:hypothetical protein [Nitrospira sp.]